MDAPRILIVEDEVIVALDIQDRLASLGYQLAGHVTHGPGAIQLAQEQRPDLVLMDIRLQGDMDGITAADIIRQRFHIPVIFLTAYSEDETLSRAKHAEPFAYLLKPFHDRELKSAIEIALYKHRAETEIRRLNRLYDVLSQVNQTVVRVHSREELLAAVCQVVVERGNVDLAWIAWLDPDTARLTSVASFGPQPTLLHQVTFSAGDHPAGQGTPGQAVRTGQPAVCNHCGTGNCLSPATRSPDCFGFQSCGSFPLRFQGQVCGVLNLCAAAPGFFGDREIELLQEVALDISFALDKIDADLQRQILQDQFQRQSLFLQTLIDAMPYPVFYKDAHLRYLGCNTAYEHLLGIPRDQLHGKTVYDLWPSELAIIYQQADQELLANRTPQTNETIAQAADGTRYDVLLHKAVFLNPDGSLGGIIGALLDITARKQTEAALRASEEKFRLAMEAAEEGLWDWDIATGKMYVSPGFLRNFGYDPDELEVTYAFWEANVHPQDLTPALASLHSHLSGQQPSYQADFRARTKDGDYKWLRSCGRIVSHHPDGSPQRMVGSITDIHDKKLTQLALEESLSLYQAAMESTADGILVVDLNNRLVSWNRKFADLWRIPPEIMDTRDNALIRDFVLDQLQDPQAFQTRAQELFHLPAQEATDLIHFQDGRVFERFSCPQYLDNRVVGRVLSFRDITARVRAEQSLRHSETFLNSIIEYSPYAMWIADPHGTLVRLNQACRTLLHISDADVVGKYNVLHDNIVADQGVLPLVQNVFAQGETAKFTLQYNSSQLQHLQLHHTVDVILDVTMSPVLDDQGKVVNVIIQHRDITAQVQAETALKESEARYRRIVETANEGILAVDRDFRTTYVNQRLADLLGYSPAEILGRPVTDFLFPADLPDHQTKMAHRRQGLDDNYERRFRRRNGSELWFIVSVRALVDPAGDFQGSFAMLTDITARRQADLALRTERNKLRNVLENIPFGVYIVNASHDIEYLNNILAQEFGPVDGRKCYEYFHARAAACPWCKIAEVFAGQTVRWEWQSPTSGKIFDLFDIPLVNDDGSISKLEIFHDITEMKRITQALRDNEQFLTDIFDNIQDGLCILDADLNIVRVNPAMERFPHTSPLVGRKCYEAYQFQSEPCDPCPVREALRTGQAKQQILPLPAADGSRSYAEVYAFPLLDRATGQVTGAIEYVRDATERIRMIQELRESELFLKETQKIARLGGWMANPHTDYLKWTDGVYEILELPRDYQPPLSEGIKFFLPEYIPVIQDNLAHCLATGEPFTLECQVTITSGKRLWAEVRGLAPIAEGERSYVIGTFQDITDRKQAEANRKQLEAQLFQAQKMEAIGTLAGGIAHDFNNILGAILGYTEMASYTLDDKPQAAAYLQQVLTASQRATDLVGQILAFSRRLDSDKKPLLVKLIVNEALKLLRASIPSTIAINQLILSKNAMLADATQVHQIIMNLATNAFHALETTGGTIDISLTDTQLDHPVPAVQGELSPGSYVTLQIKDDGPGIDPDIAPRIFEPYFTTKEVGKGTGLGLATVLGIVKSHSGEIVLDTILGRGTSFTLYFPAVISPPVATPPPGQELLRPGSGCILLVDDEPALVELGQAYLATLGYTVITATNSLEALSLFMAQPQAFDLVITDLTMPQLTGLDLAREIIAISADIPIILCTGYRDRLSQVDISSLGIRAVLSKPLAIHQLAAAVQSLLEPTPNP